jgi:SAM-dependent methyltransferase
MRIRESGMPEETYWERLFDVPLILDRMGLNSSLREVIELGCGYGTFSIPVAQRIAGTLDAFEIDSQMIARTQERARAVGVSNLTPHFRDVLLDGFGVPDSSRDAVMLFNILHTDEPVKLMAEAARVLQPGGLVQIIHWRFDSTTPRGPGMDIRPRPEQIRVWALETGLLDCAAAPIDLPPWHYGLVFKRNCTPPDQS